jgi:hypothetical protein
MHIGARLGAGLGAGSLIRKAQPPRGVAGLPSGDRELRSPWLVLLCTDLK